MPEHLPHTKPGIGHSVNSLSSTSSPARSAGTQLLSGQQAADQESQVTGQSRPYCYVVEHALSIATLLCLVAVRTLHL